MEIVDNNFLRQFETKVGGGLAIIEYSVQERKIFLTKIFVHEIKSKDEFSEKQMSVSYSGEIGEIFFNENAEIIIHGTMGGDGIFKTNTLSIKCPSKYVDNLDNEDDYS